MQHPPRAYNQLETALASALTVAKYRDPETDGHIIRVGEISHKLAKLVAQQFELEDKNIELIGKYAPFHDIGKVAIPDFVLLKRGRFTIAERAIMNTHAEKGVEVIDKVLNLMRNYDIYEAQTLRNIVNYHHEKYDGGGYPHGLKGEAIPVEARIVSVADVFDALLSVRRYKAAWHPNKVYNYFKRRSGVDFDPIVTKALINNFDSFVTVVKELSDDQFALEGAI